MKILTVASQKGGAGKTTLVRNLAVAFPGMAAMVDTDPQGTLTDWWNRRTVETPALLRWTGALADILPDLEAAGIELLLIDTPPSKHPWIADLLAVSDFVLVPVRPTPDDLNAVGPTLDMIEAAGRGFAFVLTQAKPRTRLALESVPVLAQHGKVAPVTIFDRVEYPTAAITGKAVIEQNGGGPAADEIRTLLTYVLKHLHIEAGA
jgi:chromosome partitioning protein